jgi:hypothetical protein
MTTTTPTPLLASRRLWSPPVPDHGNADSLAYARACGTSKKLPVAPAVGATAAAQYITPYEIQREANIVHNKAHMGALGVAGLAL